MAGRRGVRRGSARRRSSSRLTATKVAAPPKIDIAELREKLAGFKKEVRVEIPQDVFIGSVPEVVANISALAKKHGVDVDTVVISQSSKSSGYYGGRKYYYTLVSERDYTDDELRRQGAKLLEQKERKERLAAAKREKDLATLKALAKKHGLPDPTEIQESKPKRTRKPAVISSNGNGNKKVSRRELIKQVKRKGVKGADRMTREQLESLVK